MKRFVLLAIVAWLCGCALPGTGRARAGCIPAIDYTGGVGIQVFQTATVGYSFTTGNVPLTIDALALPTYTPQYGQTVRIYVDGTTTNLIAVTIPANAPVSTSAEGIS